MKRTAVILAAIALVTVSSAYALYDVTDRGTWPKSWPASLEPLRKQSRTLVGPIAPRPHYEIPFTDRAEFEAAWPHLLKVRSKGVPVSLGRGPDKRLGTTINAGVCINSPPPQGGNQVMPAAPLPGTRNARETWMYTTFIELVVDGEVVDLNRIPLPAETPIIDERFGEGRTR